MRAAIAAVWAVVVCTFFVQAGNALQTDLISLTANSAFASGVIGLMMACYYIGYSSAPLGGRAIIARIGHVPTVVAAMLAAAVVIVLHPLAVSAPVWSVLRVLSGFALSLSYVAVESWINDAVPNRLRGRVFSIYMFAQMAGMTVAQGLLGFGGRFGAFAMSAVLFLLAAVPIVAARRSAPHGTPPRPLGVVQLFKISPLGAGATLLAGLSWAIMFTFGPVYAHRIGLDLSQVGLFMAVAMGAGGVTQLPLGWLSDVAGRRPALGLMFAGGFLTSLVALMAHGRTMDFAGVALAGAFVFPIYAVAVAAVNDRIAPDMRVAAAAGLVLLFGIGSFFGPLLCGWAMGRFGVAGFYGLIVATMAAGVGLVLLPVRTAKTSPAP